MGVSLAMINAGAIACPILVGALLNWTSSWTVGLLALAALSLGATIVAWVGSESGDVMDDWTAGLGTAEDGGGL
jgi:hypothetical protein